MLCKQRIKLLFLILSTSICFFKIDAIEKSNLQDKNHSIILQLRSVIWGEIPSELNSIIQDFESTKTVLLYGPCGTGKTTIIKTLAQILNAELFQVNGGAIINTYQGSGSQTINALFDQAEAHAYNTGQKTIVFIDEIDGFTGERSQKESNQDSMNALLVLGNRIDQLISLKLPIAFVAATNKMKYIDPLVLSRMENTVEIKLPSLKDRAEIISKYCPESANFNSSFIQKLATKTNNFSGRDLQQLLKRAYINACLCNRTEISAEDVLKVLSDFQDKVKILTQKENSKQNLFKDKNAIKINIALGIISLTFTAYALYKSQSERILDKAEILKARLEDRKFQKELADLNQKKATTIDIITHKSPNHAKSSNYIINKEGVTTVVTALSAIAAGTTIAKGIWDSGALGAVVEVLKEPGMAEFLAKTCRIISGQFGFYWF